MPASDAYLLLLPGRLEPGPPPRRARAIPVIEFTHDAARFGQPRQTWTTAQKAVWLLFVVGEQTDRRELTAQQITATFNRHFRGANQVIVQNVARDLGKLRATSGKDTPVGVDSSMNPAPWFLTDAGRVQALALVAEALAAASAG